MRYLITGTMRPGAMPPEQGAAIYQAAIQWMRARLNDGQVEVHYTFPGSGGVAVVNIESHEQLQTMLIGFPLYPFHDWQVQPLVDWVTAYEGAIEVYRRMSA